MKKKKQNIISKTFNNLLINPIKKELSKEIEKLSKENEVKIENIKRENLEVLKTLASETERDNPNITSQLMAFNVNPSIWNSQTRGNVKDKPEGNISPMILRNFSVDYPIARACIDYIKNKITHLEWDIISKDETKSESELPQMEQIEDVIEKFFEKPTGPDSSMRMFLENIIEDYLVMGSISIEKLRTRGGKLLHLMPVDVATIKVRVNESGRIPNAPEIAYEQWIRGVKTAELTKNELIFRVKNARPNTIFGLSPLESLIIQVQSALAGSLYNWKFFTDSNQAEGFIEVPMEWTKDQVAEFQSYFDSMISGDPRYQRRIKMMPGGMKYTPTKKPDEMSFERFELWLLQQTCSVFGVPPQTLGFTNQINKATAEVQQDIAMERVGRGMIQFIEEMFNDIIHNEMGYKDYKFVFVNVDPTDVKEEAEIDDIRIRSGVISVDEVRRRNGMEEIGLGNYVMTGAGPVLVQDLITQNEQAVTPEQGTTEMTMVTVGGEEESEEIEPAESEQELQRKELQQWKKFCINAIKKEGNHRKFTEFKTTHLPTEMTNEIKEKLTDTVDKASISVIFQHYLSGDYQSVINLRKILDELNKIRLS